MSVTPDIARDSAAPSGRLPILAAVLAGGKSRRMGRDKRTLKVGGQTMLSQVVDTVSAVCERTVIVVAQGDDRLKLSDIGPEARIIHDSVPDAGPLGGLITALAEPGEPWVLAVAADMPFIRPGIIRLLWESRAEHDAVVAVGPRGPEPLLALYRRDCLDVAERLLATDRPSPRRLLEEVSTAFVPVEAVRSVDPEFASLVNVNTPAEYSQVVRPADRQRPVPLLTFHGALGESNQGAG